MEEVADEVVGVEDDVVEATIEEEKTIESVLRKSKSRTKSSRDITTMSWVSQKRNWFLSGLQ